METAMSEVLMSGQTRKRSDSKGELSERITDVKELARRTADSVVNVFPQDYHLDGSQNCDSDTFPQETVKVKGKSAENEANTRMKDSQTHETEFQFAICSEAVWRTVKVEDSWECKKCIPRTGHSNFLDFLVHTVRDHQNSFKFKCNLCTELLDSWLMLTSHFKSHRNINFSMVPNFHIDLSCANTAPVSADPFCESDSDSEPLVNLAGPKFKECNASKLTTNEENTSKDREKLAKRYKAGKRIKTEPKLKTGLCDMCGKSYNGTFCKHKRECHGTDGTGLNKNLSKKIKIPRQKHVRTSKGYLCSYCGKTFNKSCSLQTHFRVHTGEKPYHCSECGKDFSNRPNLKRHVLIHTGEKPYLCTLCGKAFNHPWTFKTHSYTHAGPRSIRLRPHANKYSCEFCNKDFKARSTLEMHIRVHTKERPYQCSYCTKRFSQKSSLNQHILNHTGHKPHKCQYCMKTFKYLVCLKTHVRTHTGERPYKCGVCEKAFSSQSNLYRHRATHTGVKRFKCDYCGKEFGQRSALGDHINIHTGARPYSCPHCTSCFANQSTLSKHVSKHATKNNFKQELLGPQQILS